MTISSGSTSAQESNIGNCFAHEGMDPPEAFWRENSKAFRMRLILALCIFVCLWVIGFAIVDVLSPYVSIVLLALGLVGAVRAKRSLRGYYSDDAIARRLNRLGVIELSSELTRSERGGLLYFEGTDSTGNVHEFVSPPILTVDGEHRTFDMRTAQPGTALYLRFLVPSDAGVSSVMAMVGKQHSSGEM